MKLNPLTALTGTDRGPSFLQAKIYCVECQASATYGQAFDAGWTYNPEGEPFKDYYCPVCTRKHKEA